MNKVLVALVAGFAAGILLAPDKGSVTRKKISEGFDDWAEKLSDLAEKIVPAETLDTADNTVAPKMSDAV